MQCYFAPLMPVICRGYNVKGHKACPICEENAASHQLKNGRNTLYLRHRKLKKAFNGHQENDETPISLTGLQIHEKDNKVHHVFGKKIEEVICIEPLKEKNQYFFIFHIV